MSWPADQHRAHLRLERAQPLRHGRLRDGQALRGALEAALFHDGGQAFEGVGIEGAHRGLFHQPN
jgi:hypothetical protein